jgi:hypothetical protein
MGTGKHWVSSRTDLKATPSLGGRPPHQMASTGRYALGRTELVEFRMVVDLAIWARDADVSAPIPDEFKGLLDGRRSRVPFERHRPG